MRISDWSSDVCSSDLLGIVGRIDEGAPDDDAVVRAKRGGKHVGALGMAAVIVAGAGLAFRIGLDEEAAEIGNRGVDLVGLGAPPCGDVRIERIDRKSTRLNSSHSCASRMQSSA